MYIITSALSGTSNNSVFNIVWLDFCLNGESGGEFSLPYLRLLCDGDLLCLR